MMGIRKHMKSFGKAKKITFLPTTLSYSSKPIPKINTVVDEPRLFYSHLLTNQVGWLLLNRGIEEHQLSSDHLELAHLLQEFSDLIPPELPNRLPPFRYIQHHINLIQGAILPNLL